MSIGRSILKLRYALLIICGLLFTAQAYAQGGDIPADDASISAGKALFDGNCASCHAVHDKVVGPALKGVETRRDVAWLKNFIKGPQAVINSRDAYAVALYEQYKPTMMPNQDLSDEEIVQVLAYVKSEGAKDPAAAAAAASAAGGDAAAAAPAGPEVSSGLLLAVIIALSVVLVSVLVVMVLLSQVLVKFIKQQKGELSTEDKEFLEQKFDFKAILRSQAFIGFAAFFFVMVAAKTTVDGLFSIGVQQGYAPEQPIPFSHKLHAGYYEIDCKFCHTTVEKSKQASIPSANICMNCHNTIKTGSPEIQKIYSAIEKNEPIQWVRVHNLPDLSYFNHSQHVKVGGVACETCHGDVKQMEVVQQHSILTMGWCIDCHRKTDVNAKGNAYYDRLMELHEGKTKEPMKVQDIGGLECSKCHY